LTFGGGSGVLLYIIMAIVIPERPEGEEEPQITGASTNGRGREVAAYALMGVGLLLLAGNLGLFRVFEWQWLWPLVLIGLGAYLLVRRPSE
jgi:hypothetical protein